MLTPFHDRVAFGRLLEFTESSTLVRSVLLFAVPFLIRVWPAVNFIETSGLNLDQTLYINTGRLFLDGLSRGDLSVFGALPFHPPLSMTISAVFAVLLAPSGLSELQAVAVQNSMFGALTCVVAYYIGRKKSSRAGWLAWAILAVDLYTLDYLVVSLDITATFFMTLSFFYFLSDRMVKAGISLGLGTVSKYPAFPIMLITFVLVLLNDKRAVLRIKSLGRLLLPAVVTILVGLPILYAQPAQVPSGANLIMLGVLSHTTPWLTSLDFFLDLPKYQGPVWATWLSVSIANVITPVVFSMYSPTLWLFLVTAARAAWIRRGFSGDFPSLAWIAAFTIVFTVILRRILYYAVMVEPALVLYSSQHIAELRRRTS